MRPVGNLPRVPLQVNNSESGNYSFLARWERRDSAQADSDKSYTESHAQDGRAIGAV